MIKLCLLIDDDLDDREIFELALAKANDEIKCITMGDGLEAIGKLTQGLIPDIIFLDVNMHLLNGVECLKEIRKIPANDNCRIIMLSTAFDPRVVEECTRLGADDYIVKPPSLVKLTDILKGLLNKFNYNDS